MRALIVGLGGVGQRHARNLRALVGAELELLAFRVRGLSRVVTSKLQIDADHEVDPHYAIRRFDNLKSALSQGPQIVLVCNPTSMHVPTAIACAQAGCDLFIEKPVSDRMDGIGELLNVVEQNGCIAMVGYQLRFHPCVRSLQEILDAGVLGHLLAVRAVVGEYLPGWHPYEDYRQMYASRADLGGGVTVSQIHEFDYLYAMFGAPRRVFSLGGHWSKLQIDVEDIASTLMECSWRGRPLPIHLQQDYLQRPPSRGCEVIGDEGRVHIDLTANSLTRFDSDGKVADFRQWEGFDRNQLFLDEMAHFLDCVERRRRPVVNLDDGIVSLRAALASKKSAASGRLVELANGQVDDGSVV